MLTAPPMAGLRTPAERTVSTSDLPGGVPLLAAAGLALVVGMMVLTTPIGSGDYGQWLMVSRAFGGETTPDYRTLAGVPPIVPLAIAWAQTWLGDPVLALRAVAFAIVLGLTGAFYAAGAALFGRRLTGLVAAILALLVTDRFLELFAFGGLPQAAAIAFLALAIAAFGRALRSPATERGWWAVGCAALFATCLSHVPTAAIGLPACVAVAALGAWPRGGEPAAARLRALIPLALGLAAIGAYWLVVIAPASIDFVANPASLSYRGPERAIDLLADYPPTLMVIEIGAGTLAAWLVGLVVRRRLPDRRDGRLVLLAWLGAAWGAYGWSTLTGASTDFPRFVPLLLAPLVVAAAGGLTAAGAFLARRAPRALTNERGLVAIGLAIVVVAPFSIAKYQTEAQGYQLPDAESLAAAAAWTDGRLVSGASILAPVREAKWIEGLTGRSALFSGDVRYAFRPVEWARSLAANALLRGNLGLANESFVLTMTDGVASDHGQQPQSLLIAANHGGEYVDLLRIVPDSNRIVGEAGVTLASLPALTPAGFDHVSSTDLLTATTSWSGTRQGVAVTYGQTISLEGGSTSFTLDLRADTSLPVTGIEAELRPPTGVAVVGFQPSAHAGAAGSTKESTDLTFARLGRSEPRLRLSVEGGGTITSARSGGVLVAAPGPHLTLRVTDLTAGGTSSTLRLLDPPALVAAYDVGAAILRRDGAYDARRARLELLGFHVARAEGPYIVMVRTGAARPAGEP